ncbi:MAG: X-Pro dipeptidase [Phycisphaeraceae bacterium]|nr:MAG: X-Pro dipeptidase [Phycisphaeraceae bacterium]
MARRATTKRSQPDPHRRRITALRRACSRAKVDALLITNPTDVAYLTGFLGGDSYLLLTPSGKPVLISDSRYEEEVAGFSKLVTPRMRSGSILAETADALHDTGLFSGRRKSSVGVQGEHMTLAHHVALRTALRKHKIGAVTTTTGLVGTLRELKDEHELKLMRKAVSIQQKALLATLETIDSGQTESDICAELEYQMKTLGSTEPAFGPIVAAKASGSHPHYTPANVKTAANKPLLIDWGGTYQGYRGDMTRTFTLGTWSKQMAEIYDIVLEAHELAAAALKPGALCRDIDAIARNHIAAAGYDKQFGHGLGHGIGMDVHESPSLSRLAGDKRLKSGHVVTIEPGIYLPGIGGVRIEDDYAITERGARNLCTLPKSRQWATL